MLLFAEEEIAGNDASFRSVLHPKQEAVLSSNIRSTILKVYKEMGEECQQGDVLIEMDKTLFDSLYKKALAIKERALITLDNKKILYNDGSIPLSELKDAEVSVAIAEHDLEVAEHEKESCTVVSPYDGQISSVFIGEHEVVQPGSPLIEVVNNDILIAKFLVPAVFVHTIATGKKVVIHFPQHDMTANAVVSHIDSVIDSSSSMLKVYAELDNKQRKLKGGMVGSVILHASSSESKEEKRK